MKILKSLSAMFFAMAAITMFGCGGGGGGGGTSQPTTATLKLLSQGSTTTGTTGIRGISVKVVLPAGVTVKATPLPTNTAIMETNPGVVVLSGATVANPAAFSQLKPTGVFTAATATAPATVLINLAAQSDFNLGEFVTVNTDIAPGSTPTAAGFTLTGFKAFDLNGAEVPTVTATIVPEIR